MNTLLVIWPLLASLARRNLMFGRPTAVGWGLVPMEAVGRSSWGLQPCRMFGEVLSWRVEQIRQVLWPIADAFPVRVTYPIASSVMVQPAMYSRRSRSGTAVILATELKRLP